MRRRLLAVVGVALAAACSSACHATVQAKVSSGIKDVDQDGVADDKDKCAKQKEDLLPPDPKDGCPGPDVDGDGLAGLLDRCPEQPENFNGTDDGDGCPESDVTVTTHSRVFVTKREIKITEKILFAFAKATIDEKSTSLLDEIADVVKKNPQIEFMEVAGHADQTGADAINLSLTKKRAEAVLDALVKRGVSPRRMRAAGYGRYCLIDSGESDEAREKNRRVEFLILRVDGKNTNVAPGCATAADAGIKPEGVPASAPTKKENEASASK